MKNLLVIIAVVLIILWLLGYFAFPDIGGVIHILLVIAVILIILKLVRRA
ncbi:MAG: lmo0937 family membrane protein [Cyclobacteriaceae bacterium]